MRTATSLLALALAFAPCAYAADDAPIPTVHVETECAHDPIGLALGEDVRQALASSARLGIATRRDDATFIARLQCARDPGPLKGRAALVELLVLVPSGQVFDYLVSSSAFIVARDATKAPALAVVARMDAAVAVAFHRYGTGEFDPEGTQRSE
jgi:hypothetical protein